MKIFKSGFSLMEMMVVLLITAIIAAASAPMISKKLARSVSEEGTPWDWISNGRNQIAGIAYNWDTPGQVTAAIGASTDASGLNSRLYIHSDGNGNPQLSFGSTANNNVLSFRFRDTSFIASNINPAAWPTNAIAIGYDLGNDGANGNNPAMNNGAIAIGSGNIFLGPFRGNFRTTASGQDSIAIGRGTRALGNNAVALGSGANFNGADNPIRTNAAGNQSIAIGYRATANIPNSIAIGRDAFVQQARGNGANASNTVAIGNGARTMASNAVALGDNSNIETDRSIAIGNVTAGLWNDAANRRKIGSIAIGGQIPATNFGVSASRTQSRGQYSIAIGHGSSATGDNSIALGGGRKLDANRQITVTSATGNNSVAIGNGATASATNAVALGNGASATHANEIVLGGPSSTVYIPGNLVVGRNTFLGADDNGAELTTRIWSREGSRFLVTKFQIGDAVTGTGWRIFAKNNSATEDFSDDIRGCDRRLKNVGKAFTGGLEQVKKLEVFNFTYKKDKAKTPHVGVMAQDLQKIFPNAVTKGDDGFLRIRMEDMFYAVVNAIKELDAKIDLLVQKQKKIDELEKRVNTLEKRLADLEKKVK